MPLPFVLFINGINDQNTVKVLSVGENNRLRYRSDGSAALSLFLENTDFDKQSIMLDTNKHSAARMSRKPDLIFNEISDADTHRVTLKKASHTLSQLTCPVLNHPDLILRTSRDQIYEQLKGIPGLIAPMTLRCEFSSPQDVLAKIAESELGYPVIVRECGLHNGDKMVLLTHPDEIDELHAFAFDGREFYLIQFIDFQQAGIFLKYRVMVIDGELYFDHLCYFETWKVHHGSSLQYMESHPQQQMREDLLFDNFDTELKPLIHKAVLDIYQRLQLDYFGIDFALTPQNEMILFEVNPSMRCLGLKESETTRYKKNRLQLNQAINQMIVRHLK